MKVTVAELLDARAAIEQLIKEDIPLMTAVRVRRLANQLTPELEAIQQSRAALFKKFGEQDGDKIEVPPDRIADFQVEYKPFLRTEVEVVAALIPLSCFDSIPRTPEIEMELAGIFPFLEG